jgi:general secretion pathway protein D
VHGRDEVSMHVEVDLSAKSGEVELGGLRQPSVSRRTIVHDIRVRQGEVSLLGGLLGTQETRTRSGVPGLMDIPVLGRVFGTEKLERSRGELLVALVPRIVRAPDFSESNLRGVSAGNDQNVKLNYAPRTDAAPPVQTPAAQPQAQPAPSTPSPAETPAAPAPPRLSFTPPVVEAGVGAPFTLTLQLDNVEALFSAPMRLRFDPKVLRLNGVQPGTLLTGDGQKINFNSDVSADAGEAVITLNRLPGSGGVTGSGGLLQLTFQAVAPGTTTVTVADPQLKNMQLQPVNVPSPSVQIVVK